jgi:hypothetical protein
MCCGQKPTSMKALQDDCWDQICPFRQGATRDEMKKEKIACFKANADKICECCNSRGLSDCKVLIPDKGLIDACSWTPTDKPTKPPSGPSDNPPTDKPTDKLTDDQIENIKNKLAIAIKGDNDGMDDSSLARLVNCIYPEMEKMAGLGKMKKISQSDSFNIDLFSDDEKAKLNGIVEVCAGNVISKRTLTNIGENKGISGITRNIPKNVLIGLLAAFVLLIILSIFFSMKR